MSWDDSLSDFLDLLVSYYPDPVSARDVAEKAGLNTRFINFGGNIDNVWMSILREARKFDEASQDRPDRSEGLPEYRLSVHRPADR